MNAGYEPDVSRETLERLHLLQELVLAEAQRQSLVAPSTIPSFWERHVLDSLQLVKLAPGGGLWVDIGTGAGFPGLVAAVARPAPTLLIEPRKLRADFLRRAAAELACQNVTIIQRQAEKVDACSATVISARAVAIPERLFAAAVHLSSPDTLWLLPRGKGAQAELEEAVGNWQGKFSVVPSRIEPGAGIIIASQVAKRRSRM